MSELKIFPLIPLNRIYSGTFLGLNMVRGIRFKHRFEFSNFVEKAVQNRHVSYGLTKIKLGLRSLLDYQTLSVLYYG